MGTTLTNGIYLPNEGEKNCYAGLKTNWETLDQKIADIAALQQAVAGALHREIVENLPTTDIDPNTIYMVLSGTSATENVYDEYMYVNNAWELIGTSATDLTNYYTKGDVDGLLLLKANASDLTSHTGDTTIHVTANDKTKWTNSANTHVLRLALSALTPSTSDNSFSNLDDSTALKVGDKVMDTAGVLFEVTAIDTANSTFTIGTALIDLAQDSDVVHKSGDETIAGDKVFNNRLIKNIDVVLGTAPSTGKFSNIDIADNNKSSLLQVLGGVYDTGNSYARFFVQNKTADDGTGLSPTGTIRSCGFNINLPASSTSEGQGSITPRANKTTDFGLVRYQWRNLWCEKLFLNGTQLDPSAFVTTDTAQTISGAKTFSSDITLQGTTTPIIKTISNIIQDSTGGNESISWVIRDKTDSNTVFAQSVNKFSGQSVDWRLDLTSILNGTSLTRGIRLVVDPVNKSSRFTSSGNNTVDLGSSTNRWKDVQTNLVNGLTPSSLSLPSTTGTVDISGYVTDLTGNTVNTYSPVANGYIVITCNSNDVDYIKMSNNLDFVSVVDNTNNQFTSGLLGAWQPCVAGIGVQIRIKASALNSARFIPCQGNV